MRLKKNVIMSIAKSEEKERLRKLFGSIDKWLEVVDVFFKHVENRYLVGLINEGLITASRISNRHGAVRRFESEWLQLKFGAIEIKLIPEFSPTQSSLGFIHVRSSAGEQREEYVVCDLTQGWLAPARESGLRGLLSNYLPDKLVPLDEQLFNDILCDTIEVSDPMFTFNRDKVLRRLSFALDDLLDPSRKVEISAFIARVKLLRQTNTIRTIAGVAVRTNLLRLSNSGRSETKILPQYQDKLNDNQSANG